MTQEHRDWLVMLYIGADDVAADKLDDYSLYEECDKMLANLGRMPYNANMHLVALFDAKQNLGNSARILEKKDKKTILIDITEDVLSSSEGEGEVLASRFFGTPHQREVDTGSRDTLAAFIAWAIQRYPATYTMLSIIGHGCGWSSSTSDSASSKSGGSGDASPTQLGLCPDLTTNNAISTVDLGQALEFGLPEKKKLDVLFLDACLMGMYEVMYEIREYVRYLVAGQDYLYAQFPYEEYLSGLNKSITPLKLANRIVGLYNNPFYDSISTLALPLKLVVSTSLESSIMDIIKPVPTMQPSKLEGSKLQLSKLQAPQLQALQPSMNQIPVPQSSDNYQLIFKKGGPDIFKIASNFTYGGYYRSIFWAISAIDLTKINLLKDFIRDLAASLIKAIDADKAVSALDRSVAERVRSAYLLSQKFDSFTQGFIDVDHEAYVDILDFTANLQNQLGITQTSLQASTASDNERLSDPTNVSIEDRQVLEKKLHAEQNLHDSIHTVSTNCTKIWQQVNPPDCKIFQIIDHELTRAARHPSEHAPAAGINTLISGGNQPSSLVPSTQIMSVSSDDSTSLDHAYGISIYLPLGYKGTSLEAYRDSQGLQFAKDVPEWGQLIQKLQGSLPSSIGLTRPSRLQVARQKPL